MEFGSKNYFQWLNNLDNLIDLLCSEDDPNSALIKHRTGTSSRTVSLAEEPLPRRTIAQSPMQKRRRASIDRVHRLGQ